MHKADPFPATASSRSTARRKQKAIKALPSVNFTPRDEGDGDVSALELKFPVAFRINERWSGFVSYNHRRDLLAESDRHRLETGLTRLFGTDGNHALSFAGEIPLTSEDFHFKLAAGFSWFF